MPGSRGDEGRPSAGRADPDKLAEWERRAFSATRRHRDAATTVDDELPDDPVADLDETRSALRRLDGA